MDLSMFNKSTELARQDGPERRVVTLTVRGDASLCVEAVDSGPTAERCFGSIEVEWRLEIAREATWELAIALLMDRFQGRLNAVSELKELCQRQGVAHHFSGW
jgi:hypothetical protein